MIDVIEFVVEQLHWEKIQPDSSTCNNYVFSAYHDRGFHSTAMEALQVLSMLMLGEEYGDLPKEMELEYNFILAEEVEAESRIFELFENFELWHIRSGVCHDKVNISVLLYWYYYIYTYVYIYVNVIWFWAFFQLRTTFIF